MDIEKIIKLQQGLKGYFPPDFYSEKYSRIERDKIVEELRAIYKADYEEYYNEKLEELFTKYLNQLYGNPINSDRSFHLLEHYIRKFECENISNNIIQNFSWVSINKSLESVEDINFIIRFYDSIIPGIRRRVKKFTVKLDKNHSLNISFIGEDEIPWR